MLSIKSDLELLSNKVASRRIEFPAVAELALVANLLFSALSELTNAGDLSKAEAASVETPTPEAEASAPEAETPAPEAVETEVEV